MKSLYYLFIPVLFIQINVSAQWYWQNPLPSGNGLDKVTFIDSLHAAAVGQKGTIVLTSDGGETWKESVNDFSDNLYGVWFTTPLIGFAAGQNGIILKTNDGGLTWELRHNLYLQNLWAVCFPEPDTGWAASEGGLLKSTDGGFSWRLINSSHVNDVFFINENIGYSVGLNTILKTTDGGVNWTNYPHSFHLSSVCFSDLNNGTAVGTGGSILRTKDGGIFWEQQVSGFTGNLVSVSFMDEFNGSIVAQDGTILRTTTGGAAWTLHSSGYPLNAVSLFNNNTGCIVGPNGVILKTIDGGENWVIKSRTITTQSLGSAYFTDAYNGIITGGLGTILKTTDNGNTWIPASSGTNYYLMAVTFLDNSLGMIVGDGGTILKTTDGGNSWASKYSGVSETLYDVKVLTPLKAVAVGRLGKILRTTDGGNSWLINDTGDELYDAIYFVDSLNGYVCGYQVAMKTSDGGISWTPLSVYNIWWFDIAFWDINNGVMVGEESQIRITSDGGSTWTLIPDPSDFGWIRSIFLTGSGKAIAVGRFGKVITTSDYGHNWVNQPEKSNKDYEEVFFTDENNGIIVGVGGTILKTSSGGGIPAELTAFEVVISGNNVVLSWTTATEINNKGYEVQRKNENDSWKPIGFIQGGGTTTEKEDYSFTDNNLSPGNYTYRLKQVDLDGAFKYSGELKLTIGNTPAEFSLLQNYPNPFNPSTNISYSVPYTSHVIIKIYDILGREVTELVNEDKPAGAYEAAWNAENIAGGVYFYRLTAGDVVKSKKMLLLR